MGHEPRIPVRLRNGEDDDGSAVITCAAGALAIDRRVLGGPWEEWEAPDEDGVYVVVQDEPGLVAALTAEGYDVDTEGYRAPDQEDANYWYAKRAYDQEESAGELREILGWKTRDDVLRFRRVIAALVVVRDHGCSVDSFLDACWFNGFPPEPQAWCRKILDRR